MKKVIFVALMTLGMSTSIVFAVETAMEKAETVKNKSVDKVTETSRDVKDKTCKMINGKLKCAKDQIKHGVQNTKDALDTKATDVKNKLDNK